MKCDDMHIQTGLQTAVYKLVSLAMDITPLA